MGVEDMSVMCQMCQVFDKLNVSFTTMCSILQITFTISKLHISAPTSTRFWKNLLKVDKDKPKKVEGSFGEL